MTNKVIVSDLTKEDILNVLLFRNDVNQSKDFNVINKNGSEYSISMNAKLLVTDNYLQVLTDNTKQEDLKEGFRTYWAADNRTIWYDEVVAIEYYLNV